MINKLSIKIDCEIDVYINNNKDFKGNTEKVKELKRYIHPIIYYKDIKIHYINKDKIIIGDEGFTINSSYVAKGLKNCNKVTLIATTIGDEISSYSEDCYENGYIWESTMCNEIGSNAVEMLIEKFHKYLIKNNLQKGIYSSLRFSPGYGDWLLKDQENMLKILKTSPIITSNSSYMLNPIKSITALIGWSNKPIDFEYPKMKNNKLLCKGKESCENCTTWACQK